MRRLAVVLVICLAVLLLVPTLALAFPYLMSPPNAATVTDNVSQGWSPLFTYTSADSPWCYDICVSTQPNRTMDPNDIVHFGRFTSGTLVDTLTYDLSYDASNPSNNDKPWYLTPGTYYWDVIDLGWDLNNGFYPIGVSEARSFTVPAVTSGPLALSLSRPSITWHVEPGGPSITTAETLDIKTAPDGPQYNWSLTGPVPAWLTIDQPSPTRLSFQADASKMIIGSTNTTTLTVSAWSGTGQTTPLVGSPVQFPVTVVIGGGFFFPQPIRLVFCQLHYSPSSGGTLSGVASQTVLWGSSGTTVTAVPNSGFRFVKWSDGKIAASRADTNVRAGLNVTASFASNTVALTSVTLAKPSVSPSPKHGKKLAFTSSVAPAGAATVGSFKLALYRQETKTVTKKIKGKNKKLKVTYWHLRTTLGMNGAASGLLSGSAKLPYKGKWEMQVIYSGSTAYAANVSAFRTFTVK